MSNVLPGLFFQDTGLATVKSLQNVRSFLPEFMKMLKTVVVFGGGGAQKMFYGQIHCVDL